MLGAVYAEHCATPCHNVNLAFYRHYSRLINQSRMFQREAPQDPPPWGMCSRNHRGDVWTLLRELCGEAQSPPKSLYRWAICADGEQTQGANTWSDVAMRGLQRKQDAESTHGHAGALYPTQRYDQGSSTQPVGPCYPSQVFQLISR